MGKVMYYTEAEAAAKLHVPMAELTNMVRDQKLRAFMDGARRMFKVDDVDALAAKMGIKDEIELSPAGEVSLSEADKSKPATKEDTVITAEGISIFDDEDLEIEAADPMAKTQIAPSIEEQTSLEGVGSGSGLLDLTRESDDTSLGAEVLDHIDMGGEVGSGLSESGEPATYAPAQEVVVMEQAADTPDASSGLFGGVALGAALVMLLITAVAVAAMHETLPGFVDAMKGGIAIVLVVCVVVVAAGAVGGFLMGKAASTHLPATKSMGS